jgi:hypothetical protein
MAIDSIGGAGDALGSEKASVPPNPAPEVDQFAAVLTRHLDRPRSEIAAVRAEIASFRAEIVSFRGGGALFAPAQCEIPVTSSFSSPTEQGVAALAARYATGVVDDTYGCAMARQTAEQVIGPGYAPPFEGQISQESGFAPDVIFGTRYSSAGAEGIAQLMPQYYPTVNRTDPAAGLLAGAQTIRHYLTAWDGDVRKALASYKAGLGRVRSLVEAHGARWEEALLAETKQYLAEILGTDTPRYDPARPSEVAVFGSSPGGVLSAPVSATGTRPGHTWLDYFVAGGDQVSVPSAGQVVSVDQIGGFHSVLIDHGNGWRTSLFGLGGVLPQMGDAVRRGQILGSLTGATD